MIPTRTRKHFHTEFVPSSNAESLRRGSRRRSNGHEYQSIKSVSVLHFDINLTSDIVIIEIYMYVNIEI